MSVAVSPGPDTEEAEPGPAAGAGRAEGEVTGCCTVLAVVY